MKKLLICLFCLTLAVALAACGQDQPVSDTDIPDNGGAAEGGFDPQASEPLTTVSVDGDIAELEALLGGKIDFPASYPVERYSVVDGTQAQIQFPWGTGDCLCRMAVGQVENMSGMTRTFDHNETVTVDGNAVSLRYQDGGKPSTPGVADFYDAGAGITYMVYITQDANARDLADIMGDLIGSLTLGE